jgi:hypothetical protein
MEWGAQWLLVNLTFLAVIVLVARWAWHANRRKVDALAERLRPEAALRGWQVTAEYQRNNTRVVRWTGRDSGIEWIAEDVYRRRTQGRSRQVFEVSRWRTVHGRPASGAIFLMPLAEGTPVPKVESAEGLLSSLLVKAAFYALDKAMDVYFGEELGAQVDAGSLKRVEAVEPLLDGYVVFAAHPEDAASVIRGGVSAALRDAAAGAGADMRGTKRPWILLGDHGVALGRMTPASSAAEIERLVRAGIALTRAVSRF